MAKKIHYFYYSNSDFTEHAAYLSHHANSANAMASLGYSAVLGYHQKLPATHLVRLLYPCILQKPDQRLSERYTLGDKLKIIKLPIPWPFGEISRKITNKSTLICKYYLPVFLRPSVEVVHSRNWNFIKAAVKNKVPSIYEHHHHVDRKFEPEIVNSSFFRVAITVSDPVRESLVKTGMPPEKIIKLHSGFNSNFLTRDAEGSDHWRQRILPDPIADKLVVYAGGLYHFKGVDLLIKAAQKLPEIQFAIAGGNDAQIRHYHNVIERTKAKNVVLLGCLPHAELSPLLQAADVLAHPHLATEEATFTSPLKFFEYMSSGTPIVASKIVSLREFNSSSAIITWCVPDDPDDFAQGIRSTLEKYPRQVEGYPSTLEFVNQFSWESRMKTVMATIN